MTRIWPSREEWAANAEAVQDAITREIARRNSDEGWAKELERRARIDGSFIAMHTVPEEATHHA